MAAVGRPLSNAKPLHERGNINELIVAWRDLLFQLRPLLAEYFLDPGKRPFILVIDVSMPGGELDFQGAVLALYLFAPGVDTFHCLVIDAASGARGLVRGVVGALRFKMGVVYYVAWLFEHLTGAFLFHVPRFASDFV